MHDPVVREETILATTAGQRGTDGGDRNVDIAARQRAMSASADTYKYTSEPRVGKALGQSRNCSSAKSVPLPDVVLVCHRCRVMSDRTLMADDDTVDGRSPCLWFDGSPCLLTASSHYLV